MGFAGAAAVEAGGSHTRRRQDGETGTEHMHRAVGVAGYNPERYVGLLGMVGSGCSLGTTAAGLLGLVSTAAAQAAVLALALAAACSAAVRQGRCHLTCPGDPS